MTNDRREFLKTTSLLGGVALATVSTTPSFAQSTTEAQKAALEKLRAEIETMVAVPARTSIESSVGRPPSSTPAEYKAALERAYPNLKQLIDKAAYADLERPSERPLQLAMGQAGPYYWNNITFGGGTPVGGSSQITLFQNGSYRFTGHLHDSGFPSYNDALVWSFLSYHSRTLYILRHTGHMAGTYEPGSRDDDWSDQGTNPALANGWDDLAPGFWYRADATVSWDIGQLIDSIKKAWSVVSAIATVITLL